MATRTAARKPDGKTKRTGAGSGLKPKGPKAGGRSKKPDRLTLVRSLIAKWSEQLEKDVTKSGVTELVRLLGLEKELSDSRETVREIKVTWVEPTATESSRNE